MKALEQHGEAWLRMKSKTESRLTRRQLVLAMISANCMSRAAFAQTTTVSRRLGGAATMRIHCSFGDQTFAATLLENAFAREFAAMLPLDLVIEDYSTNEKIACRPRKLTEEGSVPFANEAAGDLCYYSPWGTSPSFMAATNIRAA